MADNIEQISAWAHKAFHKQEKNIALFLKLTRKDIDHLKSSPFPASLAPAFKKFSKSYEKLENEYHAGLKDPKVWARGMKTCAEDISKKLLLV